MYKDTYSSRLPDFHHLSLNERSKIIRKLADPSYLQSRKEDNRRKLSDDLANIFIENAIGSFELPLGVATNFVINNKSHLIPMAVEESSIIAAASYGAKLASYRGGFKAKSTPPIMTGQIQLYLANNSKIDEVLTREKKDLINFANLGQDRLLARGGGVKDISWYFIKAIDCLVVELHVHTCEAMGANIVNTMCEKLSPMLLKIFPEAEIGLRILSNLSDKCMVESQCEIPAQYLESKEYSGDQVVERIIKAWEFAWHDPYRAATHNKGVMNGIDPILIATGNDWRAVEAGAHAYCSFKGNYRPLTLWKKNLNGSLCGSIKMPLAVGTVGGVTKLHPTAQFCLKIMCNPNSNQLSEIIASVGLAQNFSALRALAVEGIQKGHMNLHLSNKNIHKKSLELH